MVQGDPEDQAAARKGQEEGLTQWLRSLYTAAMRVGILCEFTGAVRDAFLKRGYDAISCDLLPSETPGPHIQGDCLDQDWSGFDLLICFPPCTYLACSGLHWNKRVPGRQKKTEDSLEFVRKLMALPVPKIALENPVGCISTQIRRPDQIIQPWMFGHDASKTTCLWLKGLPELVPTNIVKKPKGVRYANQTPSGQNKLGPSEDRWKLRSATYQGVADAMADQWGRIKA